ncbi:thiamine pyrophosphate-dependent enzyme [Mycobacterium sp. CPCC 205710]|uniref:Thiamine pyrophosphate-dependent enzyme n=1 Tax=Mycobacterium deserti TaxID=2978347 RepID=A0ABT2M6F6_9MYCO|nr:thiamine pyrophosphate-dependent enzyme [Mycobacterium deserti]MCT7657839.1 thiamine pyrophosphate-dependent enzyme [Mycobacterium deserti]
MRVEDGQDVTVVHDVVAEAVRRARSGEGGTLIEVMTYRYRDHSEGLRFRDAYAGATRDADEIASWRARDPLEIARQHLRASGVGDDDIAALDEVVTAEIADSVDFALNSPMPEPSAAFDDVYADRAVLISGGAR